MRVLPSKRNDDKMITCRTINLSMTLRDFIIKNQINLSDKVVYVCEEGIEMMAKSFDGLHDDKHVLRIISDLDQFLNEARELERRQINFEVLLLSICWHDIWRAQRFPMSIILLMFDLLWEGIKSMNMFSKRAVEVNLDESTIRQVRYSIRKHVGFQFLPRKTIESRILRDLDDLEGWSLERLEAAKQKYLIFGKIDLRLLRATKLYFDHFMIKDLAASFYFEWSRAEFAKRKAVYIEEANKIIKEYGHLIGLK